MGSGNGGKRHRIQKAVTNLPVQARFLAAILPLNPAVLQSLKELSNALRRQPQRRELKRWARQWNLSADWLIDWFDYTIEWQRKGPSRRWDRFYHPEWSPRARFERIPTTIDEAIKRRIGGVDFGNWLGDQQTRSTARRSAVRAFQRILRESLDEVAASAIRAGLFEPRRRRSRGRTKKSLAPRRFENEAFLWLAGYQTRGWSRERIAEAVEVHRNAVGMGIRRLSAELKMELRPDRLYDKNQTAETILCELKAARADECANRSLLEE
jgi:predicted DNA-binding protein YlxM (UPF0122 family)